MPLFSFVLSCSFAGVSLGKVVAVVVMLTPVNDVCVHRVLAVASNCGLIVRRQVFRGGFDKKICIVCFVMIKYVESSFYGKACRAKGPSIRLAQRFSCDVVDIHG